MPPLTSIRKPPAAPPPVAKEPHHLAYIDALRGLAFLGVLVCHASLFVGPFFGRYLFLNGSFGVELFFLASAITLCFSMSARRTEAQPLTFFFLRRFFRIAPLFWAGIIFYSLLPTVLPVSMQARSDYPVHSSYYLLTALFLQGWHPYSFNSVVPGGWSIAVEMTFYLFFPLMFALLGNLSRASYAALIGLLLTPIELHFGYLDGLRYYGPIKEGPWGFFIFHWFPSELITFVLGMLAFHLLRHPDRKRWTGSKPRAMAFLLLSFLLFAGGSALKDSHPFAFPVVLLALVLLILALASSQIRVLVNPAVCYLGKISFSCYLVHFAFIRLSLHLLGMPSRLETPLGGSNTGLANFGHLVALSLLLLAFTVPVAAVTNYLIERPGIAMGRDLIQWMAERARLDGRQGHQARS